MPAHKRSLHRLASLAIIIIASVAAAQAQYTLVSFTGDVKIKNNKSTVAAEAGQRIGAFDVIVIGQGASVTLFDKASSGEYTYSEPGSLSPNLLVMEARKASRSNLRNIHRNVGIARASNDHEAKMYIEKGKVTMALEEYDPTATVMVDASVIAEYLTAALQQDTIRTNFPVQLNIAVPDSTLHFDFVNTTTEPLYVNAIKAVPVGDGSGRYTYYISELGQPVGSYVILPGQCIERTSARAARDGETHYLVAAHYFFSIDRLLEAMEELSIEAAAATTDSAPAELPDLPIYIAVF